MTGRRRLLLSAGFLASVWLLLTGTVAAQPQAAGPEMSAKQIREVLDRLGGLPPESNPALKDALRKALPQIDPKLLDQLTREALQNPAIRKQAEEMARQFQGQGKIDTPFPIPDELKNTIKDLAKQHKGLANQSPGGPELPEGAKFPVTPGAIPPDKAGPNLPGLPTPGKQPAMPNGPKKSFPGPAPGKAAPPVEMEAPKFTPPSTADPFKGDNPFTDQAERPRDRAMQAAATLWERNVGPLDETPALKRALFDLVAGTEGLTDADGNNLWDALGKEAGGDGTGFAEWVEKASAGENWKLPSLELGSTSLGRWWSGSGNVGGSGPNTSGWLSGSSRRGGSVGSPGGFGGLEGSWLPVVLLAAVLLGGLIWWRFWYLRDPVHSAFERPEWLGAWPLDPRSIATREDLVLAFEYLSVLICGREARTWTHGTIGRALAGLAATHGETALLLARLYELARYAPLDEPLTPDELAEGRRIVCHLAGVR